MELRHLRYFLTLSEELNFSRAAKRLNISQPPLSQQIRQLEEELEVRLFFRTKRSVTLTDAGKLFREKVCLIMDELEKAREAAREAEGGAIGHISIGFAGIAFGIIPHLIQDFRQSYPAVELSVRQICTTDQIEALRNNGIQAGILCAPVESGDIDFDVIHREDFILALSANHPLAARGETVDIRNLSAERFVITPKKSGESYYNHIINICRHAGFDIIIGQESEEIHTILSLVAAGIGISLVPEFAQNIQLKGVSYHSIENTSPNSIETAIAWRHGENSPIVNTFIHFVKNTFTI
ncbi:MAG: LysR family transcriptional regulator [Synergistaceae bacterium]|nr:LysR family transcriptional regulator [Synergistaceae bacterium]